MSGPTSINMPLSTSLGSSGETHEPTNTYALLMPHSALFATEILDLLREFYAKFGSILHWAPVRGLGRIIIVWDNDVAGRSARRCGAGTLEIGTNERIFEVQEAEASFNGVHKRKQGIQLRLFPLPATPISVLNSLGSSGMHERSHDNHNPSNPDPNRLVPPAHPRNFLVSPPGSPPEGWEPIIEDAPNGETLAQDLIKALDALQVDTSAAYLPKWLGDEEPMAGAYTLAEGNLILQTSSGFTVAVQAPEEEPQAVPPEQAEYLMDINSHGAASLDISQVKATVDSMEGQYHRSAGWRTPGLGERTYSGHPTPTARPPLID